MFAGRFFIYCVLVSGPALFFFTMDQFPHRAPQRQVGSWGRALVIYALPWYMLIETQGPASRMKGQTQPHSPLRTQF